MYSAGIYEGEAVEKALEYLEKLNRAAPQGGGHYFYANYYAGSAMWHAGGKYWNEWYPAIRDELVKSQTDEGSWASSEAGPEFGAAMGIIMQMPLEFALLRIFTRTCFDTAILIDDTYEATPMIVVLDSQLTLCEHDPLERFALQKG